MKKLNNKIITPILIILGIIFAIIGYLLLGLSQDSQRLSSSNNQYEKLTQLTQDLSIAQEQIDKYILIYQIQKDPKALQAIDIAELKKAQAIDQVSELTQDAYLKEHINHYLQSNAVAYQRRNGLIKAIQGGSDSDIQKAYAAWFADTDMVRENIHDLVGEYKNYLSQTTSTFEKVVNTFFTTTFFALLLVSFLILLYFVYLKKIITSPIEHLVQSISQYKLGKSQMLENHFAERSDEMGILYKSFTDMAERVKASYLILEDTVKSRTKELSQKSSFNEAVIRSIGDALVVVDNIGVITMVNDAFSKITGFSKDEAIGQKAIELLKAYDHEGNVLHSKDRVITKALEGKEAQYDISDTVLYQRKNGEKFPISTIAHPIVQNGAIVGAVKTFTDMTQEKQIERAKSELVSMAAHQLRTPLSSVGWYVELLEGESENLNDEQKRYLEQISNSKNRMVNMVSSFLDASRIELGTLVIHKEPVQVLDIIRQELEEQKPALLSKKIKIQFTYADSIPEIQADKKRLRMVFQNLLSNAIKYSKQAGIVDIAASHNAAHKHVQVAIRDSGVGIPEKSKDKIFTKLYRAPNVVDSGVEGTGLGLYIVKNIIEQSGGSIRFESQENSGTIFYITFPIQ